MGFDPFSFFDQFQVSKERLRYGYACFFLFILIIGLMVRKWRRQTTLEPQTIRPSGTNTTTVSHITVETTDLESSCKFFNALGFIQVSENKSTILLSVPANGNRYNPFILLTKVTTKKSAAKKKTLPTTGLIAIALVVKDADKVLQHMVAQSYNAITVPIREDLTDPDFRPLYSVTRIGFTDEASGMMVEVTQYNTLSMVIFLKSLEFFGFLQYPFLVSATIVTTQDFKDTTFPAYQALSKSFDKTMDFGKPSNDEKERNYHGTVYASAGFPTSHVLYECMMKTFSDVFSITLVQIGDGSKPAAPVKESKESKPKKAKDGAPKEKDAVTPKVLLPSFPTTPSPHGLALSHKIDDSHVPEGWKLGKIEAVSYPLPLGSARVQTLTDPSGVPMELVEYK